MHEKVFMSDGKEIMPYFFSDKNIKPVYSGEKNIHTTKAEWLMIRPKSE